MEFKIGQKYRIIDADKMWDITAYDDNGNQINGLEFKTGDIITVNIVPTLNESFPCFTKYNVHSQECYTFDDGNFQYDLTTSSEEIFELIEDVKEVSTRFPVFCKTHPNAIKPTKKTEDGAYDLYAVFDKPIVVHKPHEVMMFNTGIKIAFDTDYVALFRERGSTGIRNMQVRAGVVEGNFRGNYQVLLNNGNEYMDIIYVDSYWKWQDMLNELHKAYPHYGWNEVNIENLEIIKDEFGREILVDNTSNFDELVSTHNVAYIYPQSKAIAQMVIVKKEDWDFDEISEEEFSELTTERGDGMMGSSGK